MDKSSLKINFSEAASVAFFMIKKILKIVPFYIPLLFVSALLAAISPLINIIMPKFIIDNLLTEKKIYKIVVYVLIIITGNGIAAFVNSVLTLAVNKMNMRLVNSIEEEIAISTMNMKYEKLEDPDLHRLKQRAFQTIKNQGAIDQLLNSMSGLIKAFVMTIGLMSIIIIIDIKLILILVVLIALISITKRLQAQVEYKCENDMAIIDRRYSYYDDLICDMTIGKEVRLYNMEPYIMKKVKKDNDITLIKYFGNMYRLFGRYQGICDCLNHLKTAIIYGFATYKVITNMIEIGSYVMFVSAANSFADTCNELLTNYISFNQSCNYLKLFKTYYEIGQENSELMNSEKKTNKIHNVCPLKIENVWFRYSNTKEYSLKNISFEFKRGKHYAIVGVNGAGKSTLIKTLMNLYKPEKGNITANGEDINNISNASYLKKITAVFQDYKLFALTIRDNIILDEEAMDTKFHKIVEWVGLTEVIENLPNGYETFLSKDFDDEGALLSGGELQKIAIARAMYKEAEIIVFDEPTASLDPYAESEIYQKINDITRNKTVIFISHRLSSCKFCDEILVMDKGEIIDHGSHQYLLESCKQYQTLWNMQAQHYR